MPGFQVYINIVEQIRIIAPFPYFQPIATLLCKSRYSPFFSSSSPPPPSLFSVYLEAKCIDALKVSHSALRELFIDFHPRAGELLIIFHSTVDKYLWERRGILSSRVVKIQGIFLTYSTYTYFVEHLMELDFHPLLLYYSVPGDFFFL